MSVYIAVDVGGTHMRAACYPAAGLEPINYRRIPTHVPGENPLHRLFELIASVWPEEGEVTRIAVAVPSPLDARRGVILAAPNIPAWKNLPLQPELKKHFQTSVVIGNDANLAALGEWKYGAGRGHRDLIYMTISTGIGSGIIIDGHMLQGAHGLGAELGHITVLPDGPLCGCGQRGHLEAVASGPAIARWVLEQIRNGAPSSLASDSAITAREIAAAAHQGDQLAIQALERAGTFIGHALADFLHIFNPTLVIIGGGVSQAGDYLFIPIHRALRARVMSAQYLEDLTLTAASLGDDVGLLGALALAREYSPANKEDIPVIPND